MHLLLSATVAIAALSASVIGVPTPLDTRTNTVARDVIDRSSSEGITQNHGFAPGKYTCGKYYPDTNSQLIAVCDATGTWIGSADCTGISCRLDSNQLIDRNGVPKADRAFYDAQNCRLVRDATAKSLFLTRNSPSERTTQSDDCLPSKYACDAYSGGFHHELIEVCDAQSNWQLGANCNCAEGCHLGGTIYEDSHGVLQGDTAFRQCAKAHDSADSGSLTGGILADNSFDVAVREDVVSNPITDFTDFGQHPQSQCYAGLYTYVEGQFMYVCNSEHNWVRSSDCGCSQCCHLSGNTFVDNDGITEAATAFCQCPSKPATRNVADHAPSGPITDFSLHQMGQSWCVPGKYSCPYNRFVYVCNSENQWLVSADCGNYGCCQLPSNTFVDNSHITEGGSAFCVCNKKRSASGISVTARDPVPTTIDQHGTDISSNDGCIPGTYACTDDYESILVCNAQSNYALSASCTPGCCVFDNGRVFC